MDSSPQPQQPEKKSVTDHIGNAWSGFKGMFNDNAEAPAAPSQTMGGRRRRRHTKSMKGGKSKKRKSVKTHKGRKGKRGSKHRRSGKSHSRRGRK